MAVKATISIDPAQAQRVLEELRGVPGGASRAMVSALNATARWSRTRVVRGLGERLNLKRKDIAASTAIKPASAASPSAVLSITGRRIALMQWGARPARVRNTRRSRSPVTYMIERSGGRKAVAGGFVAALGKSGRLWVMVRKGKPRFPIRAPYGPSIPHVAENTPAIQSILNVEIGDRLDSVLRSRVDWILNRRKGAAIEPPPASAEAGE